QLRENATYPQTDLAALHDIRWLTRIEIENDERRSKDLLAQRQTCMKFKVCQVGCPDERRQVLCQAVGHPLVVAGTADWGHLHPLRTMFGAILLVEKHSVYAIGIALQRQWAAFEVWQ